METLQKCVVFELADEDHAVSIQQVSSIEKIPTISTVPQSPTYIKGVAEVKGEVIPVVDLKSILNMGEIDVDHETRLLVGHIRNRKIGFLVENAKDVIDIAPSQIANPIMVGGDQQFMDVVHLSDRIVMLFHLDYVFSEEELGQLIETVDSHSE